MRRRRDRCVLAVALVVGLLGAPAVAHAAAVPAGLTGFALDGRVELAWQPVPGATGYNVYRGTTKTSVTTPVSSLGGPLTPPGATVPTTLTDVSAANGTAYYYAVRSVEGTTESASSRLVLAKPRAAICAGFNVVARENCLPGDTDWNVRSSAQDVDAYATEQSVDHGGSLDVKVASTASTTADLEIFRTGGYNGAGARLVSTIPDVPVGVQPACTSDAATGLYDCSNWAANQVITTSTTWPSGVYLVRVTRKDSLDQTHVLFVVRDDGRPADVLYHVPFSTYQAYNDYGGKSLYDDKSTGANTVAGTPRAVKVSFDRPYSQPHQSLQHDWYTRSDFATVRWLEASGYDVAYTDSRQLDRDGARLQTHRVFIAGAHDEYWSAGMRTSAEQARDRGVDLFFTGANEVYWKIRYEPSAVSGRADRVEVCYKSTQGGVADPSGVPTGTWRDPAGANRPENALLGSQYVGQKAFTWFPLKVSAAEGKDRVWRYTGLENQAAGSSTSIGQSLVGWEWDARAANGQEPAGVVTLASSPVTGDILQDAGKTYAAGSTTTHVVKHLEPSGSMVVATGTNHWNWGLAMTAAPAGEPDARIQQATTNILLDMGAAPETPAVGIRVDDPTAPPGITARTPSPGETNVDPAATARVSFSRAMDATTITPSTVTLTRPDGTVVPSTVSYDAITFAVTLRPSAPLDLETAYTVRLDSSVRAANGIALGTPTSWSFTTRPPDRTGPVASITAPANGATVVQRVDITADAQDNVAVAGVQFRLDGNDLASEDTTAPYGLTWDATSVSEGSHTLTAVARDTSGNRTTTAPVTVTVDPTGLVAAYGFEDPTGSATATDSSGKGNAGTIREATRSTGKFGSALLFDGVNDWVSAPDSASLDLTTAMTLEAWVDPTTVSGWQTAVMKEQTGGLAYSLYANTDTNRPSAHAFTTTEFDTRGTAQVAANTWTHLAATYDGANLRLYVNGTLASTKAVSGAMLTSTGALRLGGNAVWGEWFKGALDEVRVYRRTLTASEIQADMTRPVVPPDSIAPGAPGTLSGTGAIGRATLTWGAATDNVGVVRYDVHRASIGGFVPSAANRIAQVGSTTYTDVGATAGTWYYRVVAVDQAGNAGPPSNEAGVTVLADTTSPAVAITAPAAGATVSGSVSVSAGASDDVAVAGVRFQVDGTDVSVEDTSAPFGVAWDSTGVPNGAHVLRAIARDAAGNTSTSATVSVTVDNKPVDTSGLVAAFGFEETSGTTVTDSSTAGNAGTIAGASRTTAGRFGGALSFNGSSARVSVPDAASLDLDTAMTLEAWVKPTASSGWQTALLKEGTNSLAYALYANSDTNRPSAHVHVTAEQDTRGTAQLATGTWTHVAATWNGTTLTLYINGSVASSKAVGGTLLNSTGPLSIGGNNVWGEWFNGLLDEVRVYRRALSAAEVAADMNTPVVAPGPVDGTPPGAPGSLSATGALGKATLNWGAASDNVAVTRYNVYRGGASGFTPSTANRIGQVAGTTYTDTSLTAGDWYYRVVAEDAAGNLGPPSNEAKATVTADTTAPAVSLSAPADLATVSGSVGVTASASDDVGVAGVQFKLDGANLGAEDTSAPYTVTWDTTTASNGAHVLRAVARDGAGNTTTSAAVTVTVSNTAPPVPTGLVAAYGFEEAAGSGTATDSSGKGNTGTIREAARVAGKFGQALSFDGVNDWVSVADADTLDLTSGMTLEAWVKPATASGWRTIVMKEQTTGLAYGLYGNTDTNRPAVHAYTSSEQDTRGTAALSTTAWTHLAATYDGATLRLYVNGVSVSSRALTGAMRVTTAPLRIGGNNVWGEWFSGLVDEVRVYNRALSVAEVQADMAKAVVG